MNAIQINGLQKRYGRVQALNGLNLQVQAGSIYGFLGPNGAGKTTTLRILAGLARADHGTLAIGGSEMQRMGQTSEQVGYLPEEPSFYPWMTPLEFLDYTGEIFQLDARTRTSRSAELIEVVGLKEVQQRRISGFSHGMRQRLGLAQALINHPSVLLLDEPVSALDPGGRKEMLELIHSLRGQCTVLMSTHILADVERVCDTLGIIHAGRMVIQSERNELLNRYAVSALEVELANGSAGHSLEIANQFAQIEGVNSVSRTQNTLRIQTAEVMPVTQRLMQCIVAAGIQINRVEVVRPSLEDIFLQLTGEGKVQL